MNQSTKVDAPALATGSDELAQLHKPYGCGTLHFAGTENASYERRLIFDNVINPAAATDHERLEAVANSRTNERATCRLVENSSVGCRQTFLGVHRSSEAHFDPEELKLQAKMSLRRQGKHEMRRPQTNGTQIPKPTRVSQAERNLRKRGARRSSRFICGKLAESNYSLGRKKSNWLLASRKGTRKLVSK